MSAKPSDQEMRLVMDRADTSRLRRLGGSRQDRFNDRLIAQTLATQWEPLNATTEERIKRREATLLSVMAFRPQDEIEGLLAAQAMAMHGMVMELARRAMLPDQPAEFAHGMRKAAVGASRQFTELLTALDRKRGKGGQQRVTVEHVHVHAGGQAIVGAVAPGGTGGGGCAGTGERPHTQRAGLAGINTDGVGIPEVRCPDPEWQPVPIAGNAERPMPDARRRQHRPPHR